jgi:hypothetical protein
MFTFKRFDTELVFVQIFVHKHFNGIHMLPLYLG